MTYDNVIVGGGPAAALEAMALAAQPGRHLVVATGLGGGMSVLGPLRLQSHLDELYIGEARSELRRRLRSTDISPTGQQYGHYVSALLRAGSIPVSTGDVRDICRSDTLLRVVLADGEELRARRVILATGVTSRSYETPSPRIPMYTSLEVFEALRRRCIRPFRGRSVVIIGSGNSAMQLAERLGRVSRDVTILAKRYTGIYPQETSDRFAWRAPSQITCELIAKCALTCASGTPLPAPCIRYVVYDDVSAAPNGDLSVTYRAARNDSRVSCCSLPDRHPHLASRVRPVDVGAWRETFSVDSTVIVSAIGVSPVYPSGPSLGAVERDRNGFIVEACLRHVLPGVVLSGACAGTRSVNEMRASSELPPRAAYA